MWNKLVANSNLIKAETDKAVLIKVPHQEIMFWHPVKLTRQSGKAGYRLEISYTDEFQFKVFRNGGGKTNRMEKTWEGVWTAAQMALAFGVEENACEG